MNKGAERPLFFCPFFAGLPPDKQCRHSKCADDQTPPGKQLETVARNIVEQMAHNKYA